MTGRIPFGLLTILTALVCAPIQAQDQMGPPPGYITQPAGLRAFHDEPGQYHGMPLVYQRGPGPQMPAQGPNTVYEQLPDDLGFADEDTALGKLLTSTLRNAWFRGEYLQWNISKPGSTLLGQQVSDGIPISNTSTGLPVHLPIGPGITFAQSVNSIAGTAQSPTLDGLSIQNSNGFRGTFGVPVPTGQFEVSGFVLATNSSSFNGNDLIRPQILANPAVTIGNTINQVGPPLGANGLPATNGQIASFVSQALLTNGQLTPFATTAFLNYDISYHAVLTTQVWGTEANYVMDGANPNSPFQVRPSFGFRYFNYHDRLDQGGQYSQPSAADPTVLTPVTRQILSSANNNLFGPQVGIRTEFVYSRFLVGVEPKLMLGFNSYQTDLSTANILSSTDPGQSLVQRQTTFSPLLDLKGYGNVMLSKNVSAYMAYNFLWAGNVSRSFNDIIYNKNAVTNRSDFGLDKQLSNVVLQGISMGFDIRY